MLKLISLLQHDFGCRFVKLEGKCLRLRNVACTADVKSDSKGLSRECTTRSNLQQCSLLLSNSGEVTLTRNGTPTFYSCLSLFLRKTVSVLGPYPAGIYSIHVATMARGNFLENFYCVGTEVYF
jgi:hypothetical protein